MTQTSFVQRLRRRMNRRARPDSGFTLIELVMALFILALIMSACLYSVLQGLQLTRDNQERVVAAGLVTGILEKLRTQSLSATGFASIPISTQNLPSQTVNGMTFKFTEDNEWVNRGISSSSCNSGTNASLILRSTVTATWGSSGGALSDSTLIAPPNGALSTSDGALPVQVDSSAGTGFTGAVVTASDPSLSPAVNQTITTGPDGCAFFAQLPAGNYTVTVSSPGGVDSLEQPTYQANATINAGQEAPLLGGGAINYDQAGFIAWTYTSSTPPPALGMPISVESASQGLNDDLYAYTNTSTLTPVYPGTYNSLFAGACTDADPDGLDANNNRFYSNTTGTPVTVTPGGTATTTVPLYALNLQIRNAVGNIVPNATSPAGNPPSAVAGATSLAEGGGCPNGAPTYTLSPVTNNGLTSTSATGVGLGHLAISVTVNVGGSTYTGTASVWVQPDGVYAYNADGTLGAEYYSFANPGVVPVSVH